MTESIETTTLFRLIGDNLRTIREVNEESHEEVALHLQDYGLPWTRKVVAAVEGGQRQVDIPELLLLSMAYDRDIAWWFTVGGGQVLPGVVVEVNAEVRAPQECVHSAFAGGPSYTWRDFWRWDTPSRRRAGQSTSIEDWMMRRKEAAGAAISAQPAATRKAATAEQKAATALGIDVEALAQLSVEVWGRSLTEERDARVADELPATATRRTKQAVRGHVTRDLLGELKDRIAAQASDTDRSE